MLLPYIIVSTFVIAEAMSEQDRDKLPESAFAVPESRSWPIHDKTHALTAIRYMVRGFGDHGDYTAVIRAIKKRWRGHADVLDALDDFVQTHRRTR